MLAELSLDSCDRLVLQYPHDYATVLRLSFGALIVPHLVGLAHCTGSENPGERGMSFLQQDIGHIASAVVAQCSGSKKHTRRGGIPFHFDHVIRILIGDVVKAGAKVVVLPDRPR
jgi:hypothetical protein